MVDKMTGDMVKKIMGKGEKIAPVKSLKLKVKFDKAETPKSKALKEK